MYCLAKTNRPESSGRFFHGSRLAQGRAGLAQRFAAFGGGRVAGKPAAAADGVVAMLLLSAFINVIVKLVMEWWFERDSHRVLMRGWAMKAQRNAAQNPDVSP